MHTYKYRLKKKSDFESIDLRKHKESITQSLLNTFPADMIINTNINANYFEFELNRICTKQEKQMLGRNIVRLDPVLNNLKTTYANPTSYSTQLFVSVEV